MAKKQKNDPAEGQKPPAHVTPVSREERQSLAQQALEMVIDRLSENLISGRKDPAKLNGTELSMLVRAAEGRLSSGRTAAKPATKTSSGTQLESLLSQAATGSPPAR